MLSKFITILAWVFGIMATIYTCGAIFGKLWYTQDKIMQFKDKFNGVTRVYYIVYPGIVAIICWAWLISLYL